MQTFVAEARQLHDAGLINEAEKKAREALELNPRDDQALHLLGLLAREARKYAEAINYITAASEIAPQNPVYFVSLGRVLTAEKWLDQAALAYLRAQELDPQDPIALTELGEVLRSLDKKEDALVAFSRALTLYRQRENTVVRITTSQIPHVAAAKKVSPPLVLDGVQFGALKVHGDANGSSIIGQSTDGKHFIKIEVRHNPFKKLTLDGEREVMESLNHAGCVTCPAVIAHGKVARAELEKCVDAVARAALTGVTAENFSYLIQQFIPATAKASLGDMLLAVIEQKAFGIFHADLRPENCRMDDTTGICHLIDYDQAEHLDEATRKLGNLEFFEWCNRLVRVKYSRWHFNHFLNYFPKIDLKRDFEGLFRNGSFNLASTRLFTNQITTAAKAGIYHTIREAAVFIDGERSLDSRRGYLDQIEFQSGERVLDVGCSSGIVSTYLARRGCKVTGIDLDPEIIRGSSIVANILSHDIKFRCHDLDTGPVPGEFDTVMLFSVIHHTKNLQVNARHLASQSRRIIIECRMNEGGMKPTGSGGWQNTSGWNYATVEEMIAGLERLFPGFKLSKNHGKGDRDRFMFEFTKAA